MSSPSNSYDELGLDTPFALGQGDREALDTEPTWHAFDESPFARESDENGSGLAADPYAGEELAWLDMPSVTAAPSLEHLDDEERDASETDAVGESQEYADPEAEEPATTTTPLTAQQRAWVLALDRSAMERLPDAAMRDRFLGQDWSGIEFPGNVPRGEHATDEIKRHWTLARSLFNAMAGVTPERRVPSMLRFHEHPARPVPGQPAQKLFAEARDAFTRMRDAARADGVGLVILSSWRSRTQQASISANQPNPNAAARGVSAHMYGLAIDLQMSVGGLPVKEINTRVDRASAAKAGTAAKMGNLVRMYRSPVYKWMALRGRDFGWFPYRNEPWHWEYNPPGFKARFEAPQGSPVTSESEDEAPGAASVRTFTAKALGVRVAVYVTQAARNASRVEMLVFAHGLDLCKPVLKNRPASFITGRPFELGALVEASGRPIVLLVPFLDWEHLAANGMAFGPKWHRLAQPENFNAVAAEALEQARMLTGAATPPRLSRLILSGHSRAYGFFDALAHAHASAAMHAGALGQPTHVWALDTTYSAPIADWRAWLASRDDLQATVVYRHAKGAERDLTTGLRGREFGKLATTSQGRLSVIPVDAGKVAHCSIPATYLPRLLAALPSVASEAEADNETYEQGMGEAFDEGEDLASQVTEADSLASEDAPGAGSNEDSPSRFDAFNDSRDMEWGAESSEETTPYAEADETLAFAQDETSLASSGLTASEQRAVEITTLFETGKPGGFYGLSGNFDGQGLSFGMVNWTIGTGSLQPLLRDFAKENPDRWVRVFGTDASRFLQLLARKDSDGIKEQHRFAVEQMNTSSIGARGKRIWTVRQPWVGYFKALSEDTAFQKIQVRYVRDLLARADYYCQAFHLTSEQSFCFMFDAVASHGKWWTKKKFDGVEKRRVLVEQAMKALTARFGAGAIPEAEVLLAIADVLATTSAQRWADQVRRRKRWFVTGQHPRARELAPYRPRSGVAYATSRAS
ncbi:M15 family metallopeptidase [Bacillus sp. NP157]|nr:M15 family metallopeptidase [Bacillus sp. NP157]